MAFNSKTAVTPTKPRDKVFANDEILACTTIRDLAFTREVCKVWNTSIKQSLPFQQKLFLTPFEKPMVKPDFGKMYIEHGCDFPQ